MAAQITLVPAKVDGEQMVLIIAATCPTCSRHARRKSALTRLASEFESQSAASAVVASKVKGLSGQTAKATEEISAHISAIQRAIGDTVTAVQCIGGTIGQISEIAATAVEQQGQATQEIARSVSKAAAATPDVASNIDAVVHAIDAIGRAAKDMLGAAGQLSKQAVTLRGKVAGFLNAVQAA